MAVKQQQGNVSFFGITYHIYLPGVEKLSLAALNADFCKLALSIIAQEMAPPSLDRTQAFIVLGVVHWNKGDGERGWYVSD